MPHLPQTRSCCAEEAYPTVAPTEAGPVEPAACAQSPGVGTYRSCAYWGLVEPTSRDECESVMLRLKEDAPDFPRPNRGSDYPVHELHSDTHASGCTFRISRIIYGTPVYDYVAYNTNADSPSK